MASEKTSGVAEIAAATIPLALSYFAGIIYLSHYLTNFSISLHELDVGVPFVLTYSYNVFSDYRFITLFSIISMIILFLNYDGYFSKSILNVDGRVDFINIFIICILVIFSAILFLNYVAQTRAKEAAEGVWRGEAALISFRAGDEVEDFVMSSRVNLHLVAV